MYKNLISFHFCNILLKKNTILLLHTWNQSNVILDAPGLVKFSFSAHPEHHLLIETIITPRILEIKK